MLGEHFRGSFRAHEFEERERCIVLEHWPGLGLVLHGHWRDLGWGWTYSWEIVSDEVLGLHALRDYTCREDDIVKSKRRSPQS